MDDLTEACVFLMTRYDYPDIGEVVNIGTGEDISIRDLAGIMRDVTGVQGRIVWDSTKPDGTPRKLLYVSRMLALGWKPKIGLEEGIRMT